MVHVVQISNEPAVLPQILQKSPYYNGYTTYGGRAAYQQSGYGSPYKVVNSLLYSCLHFITSLFLYVCVCVCVCVSSVVLQSVIKVLCL